MARVICTYTKTFVPTLFSLVLVIFGILSPVRTLEAQATPIPGATAVGTSAAPVNVFVTLPNGGTIQSVRVLGGGVSGVDFTGTGGNCSSGASFLPGQQCNLFVTFSPASPGVRNGAVVLLNNLNQAIGTQLLTGTASGAVGVFVPGVIETVAGDASWVYAGDGIPANQASIFLPFGIALNGRGDLFIADSSNNRIRRVDAATQLISTYAGNGAAGSSGDGGPATSASLSNPTSLAIDPAGNVYIADAGNNVIRRVDAFTQTITTFAGTLGRHGYIDNVPATSAAFFSPNGISFDVNGNLYVADTGNNVIRLISAANGYVSTVAGSTAGFSGDGNQATQAQLNAPWSATPIPPSIPGVNAGFYIADQGNDRIRKVDASGIISTISGSTPGYSGNNGPASAAQLYKPSSVLVDVAGNLYIADTGNDVVRRINVSTGVITTYAGNGTENYTGDGGQANVAGMYGPYAFALDSQGSLYITDVFSNRIRKVFSNVALLNYPTMRNQRVSAPLQQIIENDGNAPLDLSRFNPVANALLDAATTTCVLNQPLAVVAQCTIGVDFAPNLPTPPPSGSIATGELDVDTNAANSPSIIDLYGKVLNVNPTNEALTSTPNPSNLAQAVTFSVSVTNTGGQTPSGIVTFLDGTTTLGTGTLVSGNTTFSTTTLTAGNHSITASYPGDSENAAVVSAVLTQVVKAPQAPTTTSLASNTNNTPAGAPINFTATVNIVTANSGVGNITGNVSFQQGANILGTASINSATATGSSGVAMLTLTNLPVGTDSITATYAGNSSYAGSTSSPVIQTVILATSRTAIASAQSPSLSGAALMLTATVTTNGGTPTGSVNFFDGATALGTAPLNAQGVASLSVAGKFWTVGNHSLTAVYNGDVNDTGSSSAPLLQIINIAPTSTTVSSSLNPAGLGASITFNASVTSQGGAPSGTVQFFDGSVPLGSSPLTALSATSAGASFTTSALAIGSHLITAVYSGDPYNQPSTSAPLTETIKATTDGATLSSTANPSIFAAPLTFTAAINGTGSTPTGTVSLLDGSVAIATLPVPVNGIVAFVNPALAIGTHSIIAAYSGDTDHGATTSAVLLETIVQGTTTSLTSSSAALIAGDTVNFTATVSGNSGKALAGNPSGIVKFTDAGVPIGSVTPGANGVASFSTAGLTPGQHTVTATFSGDSLDAPSSSATVSINVTIATTHTTFATNANPVYSGSALTLSSTVSGNGGTPTGTVTFHDGGTVLTSVQVSPGGTASFTLTTLAPGIHQLSASYSGDSLDTPSTSITIAEQIMQKTTVNLVSSENPSLLQDNVVISITVSNGAPSVPPTGTVVLTDGGAKVATLQLSAAGTAAYTMQAPPVGTHVLMAQYAGDNSNQAATSQPLNQVVTLRPSSVAFNPSTTTLSSGQQVTLISIVKGNGSATPTGTVTWTAGSTTLGSAPVASTGLATLTVTPPQGVLATVANYSGDALYAPSVSAPTTITVGPTIEFTINVTPGSISMASGNHGNLNISIVSATTFTDTLALGCAGLPMDATCTFSTNQIPLANGVVKSLSVEVDTGTPLGAGAPVSLNSAPASNVYYGALPAGALLALLLGLNRRRFRLLNSRLTLFALLVLLGVGVSALSGCGTNLTTNHTPAGSYTFQIVASGDKTAVTQTTTVPLTVTQ